MIQALLHIEGVRIGSAIINGVRIGLSILGVRIG